MKTEIVSEKQPEGVAMAVKFFNCFHWKYSNVDDLQRYLINKKGLTKGQIEEAMTIHQKEIAIKIKLDSENDAAETELDPITSTIRFLLSDKQEEGKTLLQQFLKAEFFYCTILECLKKEYYNELAKIAGGTEFNMTSKEVHEIFRCIPTLFKFHKRFYSDLNNGSNIGWMFIRLHNYFKLYVEYMKDCRLAVNTIRGHILDDSLHKVLSKIRKTSKRRKDDMMDLLIVPLDRIMDYKNLLDKLYDYADKTHTMNYGFLGEAVKNISEIAEVIEAQKYEISNKNEMNKAQLFFGKEIDILVANRVILRRGMMAYKTKMVSLKKKMFMFFLFNDALVWSMKKSEDPKIVKLWTCTVVKGKGKKFKLQTKGQFKTLNLECASEKDSEEWYDALEAAISSASETNLSAWSKFESAEQNQGSIDIRSLSLYQDWNRTETMVGDENGDGDEKKSDHEVKSQASQKNVNSSKEDDGLAIETYNAGKITSYSAPKAAVKMSYDDEMKDEKSNGLKTGPQVAQKSTKVKLSNFDENLTEKSLPKAIRTDEDVDSNSESVKRTGSSIFFLSLSDDLKESPIKPPESKDIPRLIPVEDQISPLPEETTPMQTPKHKKTPSNHKKSSSFSVRLSDL